MEPVNIEKLQAMKCCYNKSKNIFSTVLHYSLVVVTLGFFLSTPLWLPALCSSMKLFFLDSLPKVIAIICGPKCLFVVFNLIIIFLVGESRLTVSSSKLDIYQEYVSHTQSLKGLPTGEKIEKEMVAESPSVEEKEEEMRWEKKEEMAESVEKEEEMVDSVKKEEEGEEEEEMKLDNEVLGEEEEEEVRREEEDLEEEEEEEKGLLLPAEELNQRVEAFIAMVNMQMRLEARMLTCCG